MTMTNSSNQLRWHSPLNRHHHLPASSIVATSTKDSHTDTHILADRGYRIQAQLDAAVNQQNPVSFVSLSGTWVTQELSNDFKETM